MAGRLPPQASSLPWFSNGLTNWTGTGTLGILSTMFLVGWTSAMRFSQPRSSYDSSATRRRPGCRQFSRQGSTPSVSEWMPRTPPTSRAPSTSTSPMGGARSRSRWPERSRNSRVWRPSAAHERVAVQKYSRLNHQWLFTRYRLREDLLRRGFLPAGMQVCLGGAFRYGQQVSAGGKRLYNTQPAC